MEWAVRFLLAAAGIAAATSIDARQQSGNVVVDLGYSLHQGTLVSGSAYYRFDNVQYATAKRFAAPTLPLTNRTIQTGAQGITCAQYAPAWGTANHDYLVGGQPVWPTITSANAGSPPTGAQDDCLFLDMLVPQAVYQNKTKPSAVMVYIHGGGYTAGDKAGDNPGGDEGAGYMARGDGSVIFISLSYRLGLFGWLAGPSFQKNAPANLGLRDQRFALNWVQQYIRRFGGDPEQVLIFGESAGGGSVLHQMIYKEKGKTTKTPFKYVVPQSPWHQPIGAGKAESVYQEVLKTANVSSFAQLQQLDYASLWKVNAIVVGNSRPFSTFNFGPTVDGDVLPDTFTNLMNSGSFARDIKVVVGHNSDEGAIFTDPYIKNETAYTSWLRQMFPAAKASVISYISNTLYPPVFDGSQGYTDWFGRVDATVGDASIVCNAYLLSSRVAKYNGNSGAASSSSSSSSRAYLFSVPPGHHGMDIAYTMYAEPYSATNVNATIAVAMQTYFSNFARTGDPNGPAAVPDFPPYSSSGGGGGGGKGGGKGNGKGGSGGAKSLVQMDLNVTGIKPVASDNSGRRCRWWARGEYQ